MEMMPKIQGATGMSTYDGNIWDALASISAWCPHVIHHFLNPNFQIGKFVKFSLILYVSYN